MFGKRLLKMTKSAELPPITQADYADGKRGYYVTIPPSPVRENKQVKLREYAKVLATQTIKRIVIEAGNDGYFIERFYIDTLKDGGFKVKGIGYEMRRPFAK
jgi:riboflavin biosynthesis pyrimidine reductase